jgi:ABC-2 type transport system ATP-binding protein
VLSASRLTRRFDARVAVDNVTFDVRAGEVFGLLGPNGAGKTTTLRMLAGLIAPTEGEVKVRGAAVTRLNAESLRRGIGFLPETPGLWDHLTVAENLSVYAKLFGLADPDSAVAASLERFELWSRRNDRAALLSKGMKQKLALARALLHDPEVILLDEPTANLDPETARGVRDLLFELRRGQRAIVVSTHNLDEIERVADRIALVSTRLIAIGEPAVLRRQIFGRRFRIRLLSTAPDSELASVAERAGAKDVRIEEDGLSMLLDDADRAPAIIRALVERGAGIREAFDDQASLEDVYLKLLSTTV